MRTLALCLACSACAGGVGDGDAPRAAFLVDTLVDADRDLVAERPDLVAGKYAKMATDEQTFLRGTPAVFYRDHAAGAGDEEVTHGDGAELVRLYGDLHLENVGASFDGDGMLVDCTDFDSSAAAPFDWEVRRGGLALAVALDLGGRGDDAIATVVDAFAAAYLDALAQAAAGAPAPAQRADLGVVWDALLAKAQAQRDARKELADDTVLVDGRRRLLRDGVAFVDVPAPFSDDLPGALRAYAATRKGGPIDPSYLTIKDAARELGSGVASFANLRFLVLVEGPTAGEDDDVLLELKEERDPPLPIGALGRGPTVPPPHSQGARVLDGSRLLQATPGVDPDLGFVDYQGVSFQVRRETAGRKNLKVDTLAGSIRDAAYTDADLAQVARVIGALAGTAHARGGQAPAILRAAGDPAAFRSSTASAALRDLARLRADYALFRQALAERGPLLGVRR